MSHLERLLLLHEGLRLTPYRCPAGKLTIGVGRNLEDTGITEAEALHLLRNDLTRLQAELPKRLTGWAELTQPRRAVLIDMAFNLGLGGLLHFYQMRVSLAMHDYAAAARHMLDSRWAHQVGQRAQRLARMMETGRWPPDLETPNNPHKEEKPT